MFPATSPQKRKHNSEYRDPDYEEIRGSANKRPYEEQATPIVSATVATAVATTTADTRLSRVCQIISREFQSEITLKQQQLEEIEQRLIQARNLLDRLRYTIVADYYRKQELPLSAADAAVVRGKNTLFDEEPRGPQMALHPSLKKIIGKQPRSYTEILGRTCPERAAAQNAMHTIRARTQATRRQERRLQQLIREQGLVIDHSKDVAAEVEASVAAFQSKLTTTHVAHNSSAQSTVKEDRETTALEMAARSALNATRLNNKIKHIIVIGNTSKYIGGDADGEQEQKPFGHVLSHKWLVYVQSKEHDTPLETFVKKVRFFLHPSYRPNDIVDITAPPFQIARRGWGEFPVRIQLVFHEHLQQKPVQLVHNLVLDKTLSGLQTMGAETLMEIWLRDMDNATQSSVSNVSNVPRAVGSNIESEEAADIPEKTRTISFTQNKEELDDNLFAFLNKIETTPAAICADIEKIQPTVVVTEPLAGITTSPSKEQISVSNNVTITKPVTTVCSNGVVPKAVLQKKLVQLVDSTGKVKYVQMLVATAARGQTNGTLQTKAVAPIQPKIITSVSNTIQSTKTTIPTTATSSVLDDNTNFSHTKPNAGTLNPEKATTSPSITQSLDNNCITNSNKASGKPLNTAKNVVFQKEGKLYIIDPLQMKLKQQQKKQVSLLKPQISLLKQQQSHQQQHKHNEQQLSQSFVIQSIASDHDYTPIRIPFITTSNVVAKQSHSIPITTIPTAKPNSNTTPINPTLHLGIKQTRAKAGNVFELQQKQRIQYECHFQQQHYSSMLAAIEFLLRRLPLIAPKQSAVAAFPFVVCHSVMEFQALPALKQRACEWLRAKCVVRFMRNHKDLQQLDATGKDKFWSTREVVIFARHHAYTPIIKTLNIAQSSEIDSKKQSQFSQLVKNEVKQEQQQFQYDTLTSHTPVTSWVNDVWERTRRCEDTANENEAIDVINVDELDGRDSKKASVQSKSPQESINVERVYLPVPEHLEVESEMVSEMCRDIGIRLQAEEITAGVLQPVAQTVLAHSLHIFIERLLRRAAAVKLQQEKAVNAASGADMYVNIETREIGKAIATFAEFDFLRNCYLGTGKYENE